MAYQSMFSDQDKNSIREIAQMLLRKSVSDLQEKAKDPNWDPYAPPKGPNVWEQMLPGAATAAGGAAGAGIMNGGMGLLGLGGSGGTVTAQGSGATTVGAGTSGTGASTAGANVGGSFLHPSIWSAASPEAIAASQAGDAAAATSALGGGAAGSGVTSSGIMGTGIGGSAGVALPAAGIAAGAYTGYQQGKGIYDAMKGEDLDMQQQIALALPTFGASFLYNPVKKLFGGLHPEQKDRNEYIKQMSEKGLSGLDSKAYNVDFTKEGVGEAVGAANPLAAITTDSDKKRSDAAGMMVNSMIEKGIDPLVGMKNAYTSMGFDRDKAYNAVLALDIDQATKNAYLASIDKTFGVVPNGRT